MVNKIDIKKMKLKLCSDFRSAFVQKMEKEVPGFNKVCVIFDRYTEESVKTGSRTGRTGSAITVRNKFLMTLMEHLTAK